MTTRYTWGAIDRNTSAEAAIHLSHQARDRLGLTSYPIDVARDVSLAELLATTSEVFNVKGFGAAGDGAADDGIAFNQARALIATNGGTVLVPPGDYLLTTAFTFGGQDNVVLWLMPGVVLTGESLPSATGNNYILDWRTAASGGLGGSAFTTAITTTHTGPHAIGGATTGTDRLALTGDFTSSGAGTTAHGTHQTGSITGASGDTAWIVGQRWANTVVTQTATENVGVIAQSYFVEPTITDALTGDVTTAATIYIAGAPTEGETNAALYVAGGDIISAGLGAYTMKEITTPSALANHARIYSKADNALYFQDGAGVEHTVTIS